MQRHCLSGQERRLNRARPGGRHSGHSKSPDFSRIPALQKASLRAGKTFDANGVTSALYMVDSGGAEFGGSGGERPTGSVHHTHTAETIDEDQDLLIALALESGIEDVLRVL